MQRGVFKPFVLIEAVMADLIPLHPHQFHNNPPVALLCIHCNVGPTLVFQCYGCDRHYCGRCVWMHGRPWLADEVAEDEALADEVAEGLHSLWWGMTQKVASRIAADPLGAACRHTRQCVE